MPTVRIAIVYHSTYGHTARQAQAVCAGVEQVPGAQALLMTTDEAQTRWDELNLVDGIIFGSPTYMAGVSAAFKAFQEASSHAVLAQGRAWQDKLAAGFTNSGALAGDKLASLMQIALLAAQHGMHWVNVALPPTNNSSQGSDQELNRLGFWLGAAAQSNVDQSADVVPPESDLATARHLGQRVAALAMQLARGKASLGIAA